MIIVTEMIGAVSSAWTEIHVGLLVGVAPEAGFGAENVAPTGAACAKLRLMKRAATITANVNVITLVRSPLA